MNVKLYKKHSMQSAIALGGHHCDYVLYITQTLDSFRSCSASHLLHNDMSFLSANSAGD